MLEGEFHAQGAFPGTEEGQHRAKVIDHHEVDVLKVYCVGFSTHIQN
jgi:hypothetical protein